jgi:hypothetical protein
MSCIQIILLPEVVTPLHHHVSQPQALKLSVIRLLLILDLLLFPRLPEKLFRWGNLSLLTLTHKFSHSFSFSPARTSPTFSICRLHAGLWPFRFRRLKSSENLNASYYLQYQGYRSTQIWLNFSWVRFCISGDLKIYQRCHVNSQNSSSCSLSISELYYPD